MKIARMIKKKQDEKEDLIEIRFSINFSQLSG